MKTAQIISGDLLMLSIALIAALFVIDNPDVQILMIVCWMVSSFWCCIMKVSKQ